MHLRPIKHFGQSFLTYEPDADRIVDALELKPEDEVIEIGPGKGVLTSRLVRRCRKVTAVEIDARMVEHLRRELADAGNLDLVYQDVMQFDFSRFRDVKVIGNLPYYISSQILFRLLEHLSSWTLGVFTLQREFAARMIAVPGTREYGIPTVLFGLDTESEKLFNILPEHFKPSPDVTSTVIAIRRRASPLCPVADRAFFTRVVKAAFAQRRKTLNNNLSSTLNIPKPVLALVEAATGISLARRAETVRVEEFVRLTEEIERHCRLQIAECKLQIEEPAQEQCTDCLWR